MSSSRLVVVVVRWWLSAMLQAARQKPQRRTQWRRALRPTRWNPRRPRRRRRLCSITWKHLHLGRETLWRRCWEAQVRQLTPTLGQRRRADDSRGRRWRVSSYQPFPVRPSAGRRHRRHAILDAGKPWQQCPAPKVRAYGGHHTWGCRMASRRLGVSHRLLAILTCPSSLTTDSAARPAAHRLASASKARATRESTAAGEAQTNLQRRIKSARATIDTHPPDAFTKAPQRADRNRRRLKPEQQQVRQSSRHHDTPGHLKAPAAQDDDALLKTQRLPAKASRSPARSGSSSLNSSAGSGLANVLARSRQALEQTARLDSTWRHSGGADDEPAAPSLNETRRLDGEMDDDANDAALSRTENDSVPVSTVGNIPPPASSIPSSVWGHGALGAMLTQKARTAALGGSLSETSSGAGKWRQLVRHRPIQDDPEIRLMSFSEDVTQDIVWQAAHSDRWVCRTLGRLLCQGGRGLVVGRWPRTGKKNLFPLISQFPINDQRHD